MKKYSLGFVADGEARLRSAVQVQVEREYRAELVAATDYWQRVAIEKRIEKEVRERMRRLASPYSLWFTL
jgi:hypothetical protein